VTNHEVSAKVANTSHEFRGHKPSRHVEMFATKSATNLFVSLEWNLPRYNARGKSATRTQIMKVGGMICVADFHDLCPWLSPW